MKNKDCIQKMPMGCNSFLFETLFGNLYFSICVLDIFIIIIIVGLIGYQLMQSNLGKKVPSDQSGTLSVGFLEGNVYSSTPDKGEVPACCHLKSVTNRMLH